MLEQIRKLSFHPAVRAAVRNTGLSALAKKIYFRSFQSGDSVTFQVAGIDARFYSHSYGDLRSLEGWTREQALSTLLGLVKSDDIAMDIGANRGIYSVFLARKVKQVLAFEPERESSAQLRANAALNGLTNIGLYDKALGDRPCTETLYLGDGVGSMDTGHLKEDWKHGQMQTIDVVIGDDYLREKALPRPTVLKIDVEGYEGSVLRGLPETLKTCRLVMCEIHPDLLPAGTTVDSIVTMFRNAGFSDVRQERHKTEIHAFAIR